MRKISRRSFLSGAALCGAAAVLTACGSSASSTASSASSAAASSAQGQTYTVGICQLVEHAALDAATQGFEDALTAALGDRVQFDFQNAQNDSATCATIANGFVAAGVDLILANATPALQAAQAATNQIPILATSITEYGVALGLDAFVARWAATSPAPRICTAGAAGGYDPGVGPGGQNSGPVVLLGRGKQPVPGG